MSEQKSNKVWKTVALFKTFAEADKERYTLIENHALVKIRRLTNGYKVKIWDPPPKEEKANLKKGDNNKRKSKNKKLREESSV
jgi:hypothetical protein